MKGREHPLLLPHPGTPLGSYRMLSSPPAAHPHRSRLWLCPGGRARCNPGGRAGKVWVWSKPCTEEGGVVQQLRTPGCQTEAGGGGHSGSSGARPLPSCPLGKGTGLSCDGKQHWQPAQGAEPPCDQPQPPRRSTSIQPDTRASQAPPPPETVGFSPPSKYDLCSCLPLPQIRVTTMTVRMTVVTSAEHPPREWLC